MCCSLAPGGFNHRGLSFSAAALPNWLPFGFLAKIKPDQLRLAGKKADKREQKLAQVVQIRQANHEGHLVGEAKLIL